MKHEVQPPEKQKKFPSTAGQRMLKNEYAGKLGKSAHPRVQGGSRLAQWIQFYKASGILKTKFQWNNLTTFWNKCWNFPVLLGRRAENVFCCCPKNSANRPRKKVCILIERFSFRELLQQKLTFIDFSSAFRYRFSSVACLELKVKYKKYLCWNTWFVTRAFRDLHIAEFLLKFQICIFYSFRSYFIQFVHPSATGQDFNW